MLVKQAVEKKQEETNRVMELGGYVYGRESKEGEKQNGEEKGGGEGQSAEKEAGEAMGRVALMRVFDFVGVMEAVGEVSDVVNRVGVVSKGDGGGGGIQKEVDRDEHHEDTEAGSGRVEEDNVAQKHDDDDDDMNRATTKIIADSQADELDSPYEDDEMLDHPQADPISPNPAIFTSPAEKSPIQPQDPSHNTTTTHPKILLIISSLPPVLTPLMRENHVRGHALLVHLMRTLRNLTITSTSPSSAVPGGEIEDAGLCCLLLNTTVGGRVGEEGKVKERVGGDGTAGGGGGKGRAEEESVSVFAGNGGLKPALGKTYAEGLDLSLMVSRVGRKGRVGGEKVGSRETGEINKVVVEVVMDRYSGRVGRWCVLRGLE